MNWPRFRSASGYKIDGKKTMEAPAQASGYDKIECIYQKLPGWRTSTEGITEYDKLPQGRRANIWHSWKRNRARRSG